MLGGPITQTTDRVFTNVNLRTRCRTRIRCVDTRPGVVGAIHEDDSISITLQRRAICHPGSGYPAVVRPDYDIIPTIGNENYYELGTIIFRTLLCFGR